MSALRKRGICLALVAACRSHAPIDPPRPPPAATSSAASISAPSEEAPQDAGVEVEAGPPALAGEALETWRSGELEISAALPVGARERRPVVVGIHGSRDRPDAACARWRRALGGYPFIVCPKGVPYRGGLAWGSPAAIAERVDAALALLRQRHAAFVAEGPVVYAGWSLGATRGPKVVAARPGLFDVVVLAEVGHTRLDVKASAAELAKGRAARAIIACATKKCATFAQRLERATASHPAVTMADAGIGRGHLFDDRTARAIGAAIVKAVAADARWTGLEAALASAAEAPAEPLPEEDDEPDLSPEK